MRLSLLIGLVALTVHAAPPFEVHEWGTFTSVAGADGVSTRWRADATDLPSFVYPRRNGAPACDGLRTCLPLQASKSQYSTLVRMETPVLYFYAAAPLDVAVKVAFPTGALTEWYPAVHAVEQRPIAKVLDWGTVRVDPLASPSLPTERTKNHYYAAREVDAAAVQVTHERYKEGAPGCKPVAFAGREGREAHCVTTETTTEWERFLFYRGVGDFAPPVSAVVSGSTLTLATSRPLGQVIIFERSGARVGMRLVELTGAKVATPRPALDTDVQHVRDALFRALVGTGLFEREARAMIATWDDAWFVEGLRVFYLVPQAQTQELLPLTLVPTPSRLVRTIVGRLDVMTPEQLGAMRASLLALRPSSKPADQVAALRRTHGRFCDVLLRRVFDESPQLAERFPLIKLEVTNQSETTSVE